jgi:hypothetical protein
MPRKTFIDGDVLPASDLNNFLMNQSVMTFATSAARATAIPTPTEGMVAFLNDSNLMTIYDGTNWKTSLASTGSVLQAVSFSTTTQTFTTSTTFVGTSLELAITPKSANNKILILCNGDYYTLAANRGVVLTIFRGGSGGTNLLGGNGFGAGFSAAADSLGFFGTSILDTPNTTSSTTYTLMGRSSTGSSVNIIRNLGSITLLEVAG